MSGPTIGDTLSADDVTGDGPGDLFVACPSSQARSPLAIGAILIDAVNFSQGGVSDMTWKLVAAGTSTEMERRPDLALHRRRGAGERVAERNDPD